MTTEILDLDEISASQAQKEVTHNTALRQIEGRLVRVLSRTTTAQPSSPANGDTYVIPASATGTDWSTYAAGDIAHYYGGAWHNWMPLNGLTVAVLDESQLHLITWDGSAWIDTPATLNDGTLGIQKLQDFSHDPATTSGLTFGYQGGRVRNDNGITDVAAGTIALTASTTNYVELTPAGVVTVNATAFTSGRIPLYTAVTDGSGITTLTDRRTWVSAGGASGGGSGFTDFDEDGASTTGLTWGYKQGALRNNNLITVVAAGSVSLTASTTNYVEVDSSGSMSVNQSGFTPGRIPVREVVTGTSSITTSTDRRAVFQFAADFKSDGSVPMSADLDMAGNALKNYTERSAAITASTATTTLDLSTARKFNVAMQSNTTLAFSNVASSGVTSITVVFTQDATGGRTLTLPSGTLTPGGLGVTLSTAANSEDWIEFVKDGSGSWRAFMAGQGMA